MVTASQLENVFSVGEVDIDDIHLLPTFRETGRIVEEANKDLCPDFAQTLRPFCTPISSQLLPHSGNI
jgi:hypothetical protein